MFPKLNKEDITSQEVREKKSNESKTRTIKKYL